jgi:diadenosine tetraphosphate (Ap4A) HIT family hydrolase
MASRIYSLALTKASGVDRLSDLPRLERLRYLADVDLLATAVESVCSRLDDAFRRVNVEILGNTDAFLHAHIWTRYSWEPAELVGKPVWLYPAQYWHDPALELALRTITFALNLPQRLFDCETWWTSASTCSRVSVQRLVGVLFG